MSLSIVAIITAANKTDEHSAPLSPSGSEPATHYGLHTWGNEAPAPLDGETVSARTDIVAGEHFEAVLADAGLMRIEAQMS